MPNFSPLRYPGGKGKLAPYLAECLQKNELNDVDYIEPFAGGAGVALELLFTERVRRIHINDIDPCVFAFWKSAIHDAERLINLVDRANVDIETWLRCREVKRHPQNHDQLTLGFATFFLSRTNRSGILNGGVIGGLKQEGGWKIDCRFTKPELTARIRRIGMYRSRISVAGMDAAEFISDYVKEIKRPKFAYIDPPYYMKGACLYENHYSHSDHARLAEQISRCAASKWIVSYDNCPEIQEIYKFYDQEIFDINYSARQYAKGSEIMIFSPGLVRPNRVFVSQKDRRAKQTELSATA